jgi:hypothetical protein
VAGSERGAGTTLRIARGDQGLPLPPSPSLPPLSSTLLSLSYFLVSPPLRGCRHPPSLAQEPMPRVAKQGHGRVTDVANR